jgi:hypothetical protein
MAFWLRENALDGNALAALFRFTIGRAIATGPAAFMIPPNTGLSPGAHCT